MKRLKQFTPAPRTDDTSTHLGVSRNMSLCGIFISKIVNDLSEVTCIHCLYNKDNGVRGHVAPLKFKKELKT